MDTKGIRTGNIHEGVDISHPRLGISAVKVDGKAFNMITPYGLYMVSEGKMEFKPIPLTENWLKYFGFKEKVFKKPQYGHTKYEIKHSNGICKYEVAIVHGAATIGVSYTHEPNETYMFSWGIQYVHEFQNLFK